MELLFFFLALFAKEVRTLDQQEKCREEFLNIWVTTPQQVTRHADLAADDYLTDVRDNYIINRQDHALRKG